MSITITLPPPDPRLHSHSKGHWQSKSKATKQLRELAFLVAKSHHKKLDPPCVVHYRFFVPDRRRRDSSNMVQSTKPAVDGCVDAGLIPGDHWEVLSIGSVRVIVDKLRPRTELEFGEVA